MDSSSTITGSPGPSAHFEVFFDGDCPLCAREIQLLRWLDRHHRIQFTDIATPDFSPSAVGRELSTLMGEIHGRNDRGEWVVGVEVFRQLYGAVGFGPLVRVSRLAPFAWLLDKAYAVFARNRLLLTGRCAGAQTCSIGG